VGRLRFEIFDIKLFIVDTPIQREGTHPVKLSYVTTKNDKTYGQSDQYCGCWFPAGSRRQGIIRYSDTTLNLG